MNVFDRVLEILMSTVRAVVRLRARRCFNSLWAAPPDDRLMALVNGPEGHKGCHEVDSYPTVGQEMVCDYHNGSREED